MLSLLGGLPCPDVWQLASSSTAPHVALGVSLLTPASPLSSGLGSMLFYTQAMAVSGGPVHFCQPSSSPGVSMSVHVKKVGVGSLLSVPTSLLVFC